MASATPPETILEAALDDGKAIVVGGGIVGSLFVHSLLKAADRRGADLSIVWIFDRWGQRTASGIAGAFHSPFASSDPRLEGWTRRSFDGWDMLHERGLGNFLHALPSLFVSQQEVPPVPAGSPGECLLMDPVALGFPFYKSAAFLPTGKVFSTNKLMPELIGRLRADPRVEAREEYLPGPEALAAVAAANGVRVVLAAPGFTAPDLFPGTEVEGDLGILLRTAIANVPPEYRNQVVMDEDDITTPTYSIPQLGSGVVGFGGTTFNRFTWPCDFVASGPRGTLQLMNEDRQRHIQEEAEVIRRRLLDRFPNLEFLKAGDYEVVHQYRPAAARIIVKLHSKGDYSGLLVVHVNGLGGSGFTIAPAVVQDALALPIEEVVNDRELDLMDE